MPDVIALAAVLSLAVRCAPGVDPNLLAAIAQHESGLNATAVHVNTNGTHDVGLMQINSANFGWLGLTEETARNPCVSLSAGAQVLTSLSRYNTGTPALGIANGYARAVLAQYRVRRDTASAQAVITDEAAPTPPACDAAPSDVWGQAACRERQTNPGGDQSP